MIPLSAEAFSDAETAFVTRLTANRSDDPRDSFLLSSSASDSAWCGDHGVFSIRLTGADICGDVLLVDPKARRAERLIRRSPAQNSLLITEQCDQLCIMCSQPPKKTHWDRFAHFEQACRLAEPATTIGITGGEPTLHLPPLLAMMDKVLEARPDLSFHVLTNGQHFTGAACEQIPERVRRATVWGIPLYADRSELHDRIVGKLGAFERLLETMVHLLVHGARIELRTVLMQDNLRSLPDLARFISTNLPHIEQWSIMGLENIGFARSRWHALYADIRRDFSPVGQAIDHATLFGTRARLFNMPLCHLPPSYRPFAVASISDWKQRFSPSCFACSARSTCSGFFEWHPDHLVEEVVPL